ncbi:hypothetical protein RIF29_38926 [Crotalaria pallida]|uniref:Cytochrome P450 n=1 Tax=Crotalaria pallida TaxID=3830 RepID=A0AAN9E0A0_CROPI
MDSITSILLLLLLTCIVTQYLRSLHARSKKSNYKLPPGPSFLTIIRNLPQLSKKPQLTLANFAKLHGPIMRFKLGQVTTIVISSPNMAKEVLQTHDLLFSNRTVPQGATVHNHDHYSLAFLPISPLWRDLRKIFNNQMFSNKVLDSSQDLRCKKVQELISDVHESSLVGETIDIGKAGFKTFINLLSNTFFSKDSVHSADETEEYKDIVLNLAKAIGTPDLVDFFPMLKVVDPQGVRRRSSAYVVKLFIILDRLIDERLKLRERKNYVMKNDMLDTLLNVFQENSQKIDRDMIKHLFIDLVVAATDTTSYAFERAMNELLHNPDAMSKAKKELEQTIGIGNPIEESHIPKLPYLQAIIKETLRLHPPAPFLLPRKAKTNVEISGLIIPEGAQILINEWAIGRNSSIWNDPNSFLPERFLLLEIDFKGRNFQFTPFGGGRRMCPGMSLATRMMHMMLGSLINSFDWKFENGMKPEDMDKDQPLRAMAEIRINS